MGKLLSSFKKTIIDEIVDGISSNTSHYYAFASNPIAYTGLAPDVSNDDYSTNFLSNWQLLFGKKIKSSDIAPVISKNMWTSNTIYDRYDNTSNTVISNNNFYVVSMPSVVGGYYHIYKCIDNANGNISTIDPGSIGTPTQTTSFVTTGDGYRWRYVSSFSSANFDKFASQDYVPVYANATLSSTASSFSGVEVVIITNSGNGYTAYTNGTVSSVQNSTVIQIENSASGSDDFYVNSAIYTYNTIETTSQLRLINDYVVNSSGKFIVVNTALDTTKITSGLTQYLISPAVIFETDGDSDPRAITYVNTTSYSIQNVVMLDIGSNISWANVKIQSNYGSGANVYAITPPPGGHGFDPITELNVKGLSINFTFANSEVNSIPTANILYNKIGIFKNPYSFSSNIASGDLSKGTLYTSNTFNQLLIANVSPSYVFNVGETLVGSNSGARGTVVFSNATNVFLSGDKYFIDGEFVSNSTGTVVTSLSINSSSVGIIYSKEIKPIYVENINNVNRSNNQTEAYKLTIEI
jgi:hypothetical protein